MEQLNIIDELSRNKQIIIALLTDRSEEEYRFRPNPEHWSMIEVLCHLVDEEVEDFRIRVRLVLENSTQPLPGFNPIHWVKSRKYQEQNLNSKLKEFVLEREKSINWLLALNNPNWQTTYQHPKMGVLTAEYFLHNWLAHDYIHIRQLNRISYSFLNSASMQDLTYAGNF